MSTDTETDAKAIRYYATMAATHAEIAREAKKENLSSMEEFFAQRATEEARKMVDMSIENPSAAAAAMKTVKNPQAFLFALRDAALHGVGGKTEEALAVHRFQTSKDDGAILAFELADHSARQAKLAIQRIGISEDAQRDAQDEAGFLARQAYYANKGATGLETSDNTLVQASIKFSKIYDAEEQNNPRRFHGADRELINASSYKDAPVPDKELGIPPAPAKPKAPLRLLYAHMDGITQSLQEAGVSGAVHAEPGGMALAGAKEKSRNQLG